MPYLYNDSDFSLFIESFKKHVGKHKNIQNASFIFDKLTFCKNYQNQKHSEQLRVPTDKQQ